MIQVVGSSPDDWTKVVSKAQEAQAILVDCDCSSLKVWEDAGQRGLRCLEESVSYLEKMGSLTDWDQQQIEHEMIEFFLAGASYAIKWQMKNIENESQ